MFCQYIFLGCVNVIQYSTMFCCLLNVMLHRCAQNAAISEKRAEIYWKINHFYLKSHWATNIVTELKNRLNIGTNIWSIVHIIEKKSYHKISRSKSRQRNISRFFVFNIIKIAKRFGLNPTRVCQHKLASLEIVP